MRCRRCNNPVFAVGLCRKHLIKEAKTAEKMIENALRKEHPYRATADICRKGVHQIFMP